MMESPLTLDLPDADILFFPQFFTPEESDIFFHELGEGIAWKQEKIRMFGKPIDQPRLTAWYGEEGKSYTYSGLTVQPEPWTDALLAIKRRIEPSCGTVFNSVLLNLYRSEKDSVSWHSDDETELGVNPVIGSVSFGSVRRFGLKHKERPELRHSLDLTHGSLLIMRGPTQHFWKHQIPKSSKALGPRINLTFRVIG